MKRSKISLALLGAGILTTALTGCGGGGGTSTTTPTSTTLTSTSGGVTLGKFSENTVVKYTNPADGSSLGTGKIGPDGKFTISLPTGYTGPVGVTIVGDTGVTYYDEGTKKNEPFGPGKTLRAYMPSPQSQVGVTALTNAAAAKADAIAKNPSHPTADEIRLANTKVAAAFGYTDGASILEMPTIVDATTKIGASTPADKYALLLAGLAKTAQPGSTAVDVTAGLASDLKSDDVLDGTENTGSATPTTIPSYTPPTSATLTTKYDEAANELISDSNELSFAKNTPPAITPDVTKIIAVSNASDVNLAKAMFADLRTTLNAFSNGSKTGFLNTQAANMHADLSANVTPAMSKVVNRISTLGMGLGVYRNAMNYSPSNTQGLVSIYHPLDITSPTTGWTTSTGRTSGSVQAVMYGYGSYDSCWTDLNGMNVSGVTCIHAGPDSADWLNSQVKVVAFHLTNTAWSSTSQQYSYTAARYDMKVSFDQYGNPMFGAITAAAGVPSGSGTAGETLDGNGQVVQVTASGTLPPSATTAAGTPATGVDTIAISSTRSALAAANNFRYALSGSISTTNAADANKVVTLSFDNGSYVDLDETTIATTGSKIVAAKLIGSAQTAATKFTGTLDVDTFMTALNGQRYAPTHVVFNGSLSDLTSGGGQFLTGKLEGSTINYNLYDTNQTDSATNYEHKKFTFTGTVQAPNRPLLTLVVAADRSGFKTWSIALNYTYGTTSITGSGTHDSANPANDTLTLSNQNGIQVVTSTGAVTKSGASVATITNGAINYVDGVTESLM